MKKLLKSLLTISLLLSSTSVLAKEATWDNQTIVPINQNYTKMPNSNCVPSSIINALHYTSGDDAAWDNYKEVNELRQYMINESHKAKDHKGGFTVDDIEATLKSKNIEYERSLNFELSTLKCYLENGVIIYLTDITKLEDYCNYKTIDQSYHAVTVIGYKESKYNVEFLIVDSATGEKYYVPYEKIVYAYESRNDSKFCGYIFIKGNK